MSINKFYHCIPPDSYRKDMIKCLMRIPEIEDS